MEHVAHVEVHRDPIEEESCLDQVSLNEILVLFREVVIREVSGDIRESGILEVEEFEVHSIRPGDPNVAVFARMSAFAVRLAFEEFAGAV